MTPDKTKNLANDISCVIATLQAIADDLLTAYPGGDYNEPEPALKPLTLEDVRGVLAGISRDGKTAAVKELLGKYGVEKLSELSPDYYADLLVEAEGIA